MRRKKCFTFILILFFIVSLQSISAETYTSTYVQETPLQFQYGPPPILQGMTGTEITSQDFVSLLGTLTIVTLENNMFDPSLMNLTFSNNLRIIGPGYENGTYVYNPIDVYLRAVSVAKNKVSSSKIITPPTINLASNSGNVIGGTDTFTTYILLVNSSKGPEYFIPGQIYTLMDDSTIGTFGLQVGGTSQTTYPLPIEVDGIPIDTAPIIDVGGDPSPPIPYEGDGNLFDEEYFFSILNNIDFLLEDITVRNLKPIIATANLNIALGNLNEEYGVKIAFTNPSSYPGFQMQLQDNVGIHSIPYLLYFGQELVTKNVFLDWRGLYITSGNIGTFQKDISVDIIDTEAVQAAPAGLYSDTITVIIVPYDVL